ncbi:hypothetical protein H2198_001460 [Neophaeococcomyces mojaviensis]|uniref:Uncharacterized protein n=1 Tax=Neophaeococcomyces mojaviensis TaxID=3383035 RepID=A0ACC3AH32_9EURO|nr:hypothetical protein H2198_001460 [Knufia sp. JES_112]
MSSSASSSAQPTSAASTGSQDISNVLGSIGQSSTKSASATQSSESSESSASSAPSGSSSASKTSAAGSNTITNAPQLSTASSTSASASSLSDAPSLTSGNVPKLSDLPTLSGYYSYPPPTVPPTSNAPYLRKTNLPENFVFIVVGATIAFVALVIIVWRVFTSWSINRRFQRHEGGFAGRHGNAAYTPLADIKQKPPVASSHDMKDLGNLPRNFSSVPSLFFSPTAEVARHSMRPVSSKTESRQHLPAGHYRDASDGGR